MFQLCLSCAAQGFCNKWRIVTDHELANPYFILDVRNYVYHLQVPKAVLIDHLLNELSRLEGEFVSSNKASNNLDFDQFEAEETAILSGSGSLQRQKILDWIGYNFGREWPDWMTPNLGATNVERFRVIATAVRTIHWRDQKVRLWGLRAANDN